MNQTNRKSNQHLRDLILCVVFSIVSFVALFFSLSYLFFQLPDFDDYESFFPYAFLLSVALLIILICRRFAGRSVYYTIASSSCVSLLSLLAEVIFYASFANLPQNIALHCVFVFVCFVIQLILQKKRPNKRKKMPFIK